MKCEICGENETELDCGHCDKCHHMGATKNALFLIMKVETVSAIMGLLKGVVDDPEPPIPCAKLMAKLALDKIHSLLLEFLEMDISDGDMLSDEEMEKMAEVLISTT